MSKILFVQVGSGFRNPNKHLITYLRNNFPENEIEILDVLEVVKKNYLTLIINLFYMLKEYFFDLITSRKSLRKYKAHLLGTPYLFKQFSKIIQQQLRKEDYLFILQTQSMCDSSNETKVPFFIYTDHTNLNNLNYAHIRQTEYLHSNAYVKLEKHAFDMAKLIFVMSMNIKESLMNQYSISEEKIKIVYVGTNTAAPVRLNPEKYSKKNILFVGKDWERKGGPLLVDAFKIVQQAIPDASLTIMGCTPALKLKNCFVHGEVSLKVVEEIYSHASLFCMPTLREPFGIVFLEAMFNRLPVITNNIGATPHLIKNGYNGYILDYDRHTLAEILITLLNSPKKCSEMGNNAYESVQELYTWENVAKRMSGCIRATLPDTSPPGQVNEFVHLL
jgi:glycosyltransferase involved in cell wall biosynthesis